jgi:hypothetical protein
MIYHNLGLYNQNLLSFFLDGFFLKKKKEKRKQKEKESKLVDQILSKKTFLSETVYLKSKTNQL